MAAWEPIGRTGKTFRWLLSAPRASITLERFRRTFRPRLKGQVVNRERWFLAIMRTIVRRVPNVKFDDVFEGPTGATGIVTDVSVSLEDSITGTEVLDANDEAQDDMDLWRDWYVEETDPEVSAGIEWMRSVGSFFIDATFSCLVRYGDPDNDLLGELVGGGASEDGQTFNRVRGNLANLFRAADEVIVVAAGMELVFEDDGDVLYPYPELVP